MSISRPSDSFTLPVEKKMVSDSVVASILNNNYSRAFSICDSMSAHDCKDPIWPLLELAAIGLRDVDFDSTMDSTGFLKHYSRVSKEISDYQLNCKNSSYALTLDGIAKAMHSTFYLRIRSFIPALQNGFTALRLLRDARSSDPGNTDVNFFLGLYSYANGELKKNLWWVLFWYPGSKKDGIAQLEQCIKSGQITATAARLALCDIYIREGSYSKSTVLMDSLIKQFPKSRFVLWTQAKLLESQKSYTQAAQVYGTLADSYRQCNNGTYNMAVTSNKQAHMLYNAGDYDHAQAVCNAIIDKCTSKKTQDIKKDTSRLSGKLHAINNR